MPIAYFLAILFITLCVPQSIKADEPPPAGCFASIPDDTLEIEGNSDIKAWIGHRADGTWDGCLRLIGCSWRIEDAQTNFPSVRPYLVDALVHPKCNVRWVNSVATSECESSSELVTSFEKLASLISDSLSSGSGICGATATTVLVNNADVFEFNGSVWNRFWLPVDGWCIEAFVRLADGASSLGIGKDCPDDAARWASFAANLTNNAFPQSNTWLVGHAGDEAFGSSIDLSPRPAKVETNSFVTGALQTTYVSSWLQRAAIAANSKTRIDLSDDPLKSISGKSGTSGRLLHWLAAASSRLSTIPFDASSGWDDDHSRSARKWSALIDLSDEPELRGSHFRAELARSP